MADTRCWTKRFVAEFIQVYKDNPCLWQVQSKQYSNRKLRNEAYDKLVAFCKPVFPEASRDFVVKKVQSLRGSFRKEAKKVLKSKQSGEVYIPGLWYYDQLVFTLDQDLPASNTEDIDSCLPDEEDEQCEEDSDGCNSDGVNMGSFMSMSQFSEEKIEQKPSCSTDFEELIPEQSKKRKRPATVEEATQDYKEAFTNATNTTTITGEIKEFEAIGINVAKKMQRMDPVQALYAESLINDVLRRGLLNTLRDCTDLCDNHCNTLAKVLNSRSPPPLLVTDVSKLSDQGQS